MVKVETVEKAERQELIKVASGEAAYVLQEYGMALRNSDGYIIGYSEENDNYWIREAEYQWFRECHSAWFRRDHSSFIAEGAYKEDQLCTY